MSFGQRTIVELTLHRRSFLEHSQDPEVPVSLELRVWGYLK